MRLGRGPDVGWDGNFSSTLPLGTNIPPASQKFDVDVAVNSFEWKNGVPLFGTPNFSKIDVKIQMEFTWDSQNLVA